MLLAGLAKLLPRARRAVSRSRRRRGAHGRAGDGGIDPELVRPQLTGGRLTLMATSDAERAMAPFEAEMIV